MARELGMNPAKLGKLANHRQEHWKAPLPQFIEELYYQRLGRTFPETVLSIEERHRRDLEKKELRRTARRRCAMRNSGGNDRRWVVSKDFDLADEVRYIQRRSAERDSRIVTIGPLLLFSTDSGDAWILDPTDHLATRVAESGDSRPARTEETEKSFAVNWEGRYEIIGSAFVFSDDESGRVTTILGYPTRQIADRIGDVFG